MALYVNQRGEVVCGRDQYHGGPHLAAIAKRHPERHEVVTPREVWKKIPTELIEAFDLHCDACPVHTLPKGVQQAEGLEDGYQGRTEDAGHRA